MQVYLEDLVYGGSRWFRSPLLCEHELGLYFPTQTREYDERVVKAHYETHVDPVACHDLCPAVVGDRAAFPADCNQ